MDKRDVFSKYLTEDQKPVADHQLTPDDMGQLEEQLIWERGEITAGRQENALLHQALAGHWTADHVIEVARRRGMSYRMSATLADKMLQLEGYGLLDLIAESVGLDLAEAVVRKALATWERGKHLFDRMIARYGEEETILHLRDDFNRYVASLPSETNERNKRRANRLLE